MNPSSHTIVLFLICALNLTGCQVINAELKSLVCDRDNDGIWRNDSANYCGGNDCDDSDASLGAPSGWFRDVDGDGYGAGEEIFSCTQPEGYVPTNGDCDDTNANIHPEAVDICNNIDDNCDGIVDDEEVPTWYIDADEDGYGNPEVSVTQCDQPEGYVSDATDCDDSDPLTHPGAEEICDDGIDQDCNGIVDDAEASYTLYRDADGDGYGNLDEPLVTCVLNPDGYVENALDCDDGNPLVNPSATEICGNGIDDNCDGNIDTDAENLPWYLDADGDGYGDEDVVVIDCAPPTGYVGTAGDCDDARADINPGMEEVCNNGIDDNCDASAGVCEWSGTVSLTEADATIDGVREGGYAGFALANAGNVRGDGYDTLAVAVPFEHTVYVFASPITGALDTSFADITLNGPSGSYAGMSVLGSCDLRGDGTADDLLIGGPYDATNGSEAGAVWVLYGPLSDGVYTLDTDADVKLLGTASSQFGSSIACGDTDGDGVDDILIGAALDDSTASDAGAVYVGISPVTDTSQMYKLSGEAFDNKAGTSVAMMDHNGDGYDDLVVGAFQESTAGTNAGAVYIVYSPVTSSRSLADADVKLLGESASHRAGRTLTSADLNDDGYDDLLVGAYGVDSYTGATYVVYGPSTSGSLASHPRVDGAAVGDSASFGLAQPCDTDGDGIKNVIIGAREEHSATGAVYVINEPITSDMALTDADLTLTGVTTGDYVGAEIATMDLDADGFCDLAISAYQADYAGSNTGRIYILYGLGY